MVTFICYNCNSCLRKKQIEKHSSYCGSKFSCVDCKKEFNLIEANNHTYCQNEMIEDNVQLTVSKLIKNLEFFGIRRTIRKLIKKSPIKQLKISKIKQSLKEILKRNSKIDKLEVFDELFNLKILNIKNVSKNGDYLKYKLN